VQGQEHPGKQHHSGEREEGKEIRQETGELVIW
jgi:hypothetical protein